MGPSRDLNSGPPAPKAGIIATRPHGHIQESTAQIPTNTAPATELQPVSTTQRQSSSTESIEKLGNCVSAKTGTTLS